GIGAAGAADTGFTLLLRNNLFLLLAAACACLPVGRAVRRRYRYVLHKGGAPARVSFGLRSAWLALLLLLSTVLLVGNSYNPFIYFRF
ncbi:MAG: hypothetical protein LBD12_04380, partial [Clostridiales Family XIII bacterium]|nr:hypothetical protein [Clostridiales Family XIII bacterium]